MTKWSLGYEIMRLFIRQNFRSFYKRIESIGNEYIPSGKPIIFAANHQNALMDPLGILFSSKEQTVFLTRSDIFNNPILLKIFTFFKMLPVYRIRDGKEALKNNERIFNTSVEILEAKMSVALFPEATHNDKRRLRIFKKAVPRIAFRAEEKNNYELDLQIVPVGIYYEEYTHSNGKLFINYGKPFTIKEYRSIYEDNDQKGFKALRERMEAEIKPLIINQPDLEHYDLYEGIRVFNRPNELSKLNLKDNTLANCFKADKETVNKLEEFYFNKGNDISDLDNKYSAFKHECDKEKIRVIDNKPKSAFSIIINSLLFIIGFPIFIFAFINNYIYFKLIINFIKKIKDPQLHSSIKFALSLLVNFIAYPIHAAILWAISGNGEWALIYLALLPLTALFANKYRYAYIDFMYEFRLLKFSKSNRFSNYLELKKSLNTVLEKAMN